MVWCDFFICVFTTQTLHTKYVQLIHMHMIFLFTSLNLKCFCLCLQNLDQRYICVEESFDCLFVLLGQDLHDKALLFVIPKIPFNCVHQRQYWIAVPPPKLYISQTMIFIYLREEAWKAAVAQWDGTERALKSETAYNGGLPWQQHSSSFLWTPHCACSLMVMSLTLLILVTNYWY